MPPNSGCGVAAFRKLRKRQVNPRSAPDFSTPARSAIAAAMAGAQAAGHAAVTSINLSFIYPL
jgi:hypothetical protein